jgi:DHA3 family macrolide efflux protein-like MFS transporter
MEILQKNEKVNAFHLFKLRDFSLILIANFISRLGDSIDSIAFGWMVYELTGSKLLLGSIFAVNAIPNIIFGPFAGVLADKLSKKNLIFFSFLGRGLVVTLTALLFFLDILAPWHLFVFTFINSTFETLNSPALISLLPLVVPKEKLLVANSFSSSAYKFAELVGLGLASVIIGLIGISGAIFIDALTFFMASILILFIKYSSEEKETIVILFALINFCLSPVNILMPAFTKDILKSGPDILGLIGIVLVIGTILGGLIVAQIGSKYKITSLIIYGFLFLGINYMLLSLPEYLLLDSYVSIVVASIIFFNIGLSIPLISSPVSTYLMVNTDKSILGRISSFIGMITLCAQPLGSSLTGVVTEYISMSTLFLIMGLSIVLLSLVLKYSKTLLTEPS